MSLASLSDAELWELILTDDRRAFTVLFDRHWLRLYHIALRYLKDEEGCEQVVHDLFLTLWKRKGYLKIENFDSYLKVATRYQVYAYLKGRKKSTLIYVNNDAVENTAFELNNGYERLVYNELEMKLNQQLKVLPHRCQEIFILSRFEKLSNIEIAEKLHISKKTVENQLTSALRFIRKSFSFSTD